MKVANYQDRLKELFDNDPRTDSAIAASLGVSKQALSMWRTGNRSPKKSALIKIAEEYNVSVEWIMGFDVERNGSPTAEIAVIDSEMFAKIIYHMSKEDHQIVMDIINKTYKQMKAKGIEL